MQISFVVLAVALFATAHGLATPIHGARLTHRHANIAKARAPAPESSAPGEFFSKRGLRKRCKARVSGGLSIPTGVGNAANDPADGGIGIGVSIGLPPPPPTEPAPEPPKATTPKSEPTTTKPKPKPTSSSPPPQPTGGGGNSGSHNGQATFYNTGLTACGVTNNDGQNIVAVSEKLFDTFPGYNGANPNNNPICGKKIMAHFQGKTLEVVVTDKCVACAYDDLDFTPTAFQKLIGDLGIGRTSGLSWDFI